ncbi:MAG: VOC family protein [Anaerolineales bacterium]
MTENGQDAAYRIPAGTHPGLVALTVANLDGQVEFYQQALNMKLYWKHDHHAGLGAGGSDLLALTESDGALRYHRVTGLYHLAIRYPDGAALARAIARLFELRIRNSPTDHIMTKSTYLEDPEGNGIELYAESPEDGSWRMEGGTFRAIRSDGTPSDGREPLDLEALFRNVNPDQPLDEPMPAGSIIGHVHLHVRDLHEALDFYHGALGFDIMGVADEVGMAFVSAGGYHHHIGLNTWQGKGAPPAPGDALGLRYFTILLPNGDDLARLKSRLTAIDTGFIEKDAGIEIEDPSANRIRLESG